MKYKWSVKKLSDIATFNPQEKITRGTIAKKIPMEMISPFCRDIVGYEYSPFYGGSKFRNGDTLMARITPCLENGKIAKVNILDKDEVAFGSTEYIVLRPKTEIDSDYLYYLTCSSLVRDPAIKSMVGSSGRQRVQLDVLKDLEVLMPPFEIQKMIGKFLKDYDDGIFLRNQINKNLAA